MSSPWLYASGATMIPSSGRSSFESPAGDGASGAWLRPRLAAWWVGPCPAGPPAPGSATRAHFGEVGSGGLATDSPDVLLVFQDDPQAFVDELRRQLARAECDQGSGPVQRLG